MNSIFEIESRIELSEAYDELYSDMSKKTVSANHYGNISVLSLIDNAILDWPYREGSISIDSYLNKKGIDMDINNTDYSLHEKILYCLELYYNLLKWSVIHNDNRKNKFEFSFDNSFDYTINAILENIIYILEKSNYCIREKRNDDMIFPQYLLYKRDASVDAVLEYVPDISDILLGYLDFRNRNNREYKKNAIIQLYNFMEPNRAKYKGYICGSISEEFFVSSNKLGIRHNNKDQIKIHYTKRIQIYDKLFKMALFVILTEQITQYKNDLASLRAPM